MPTALATALPAVLLLAAASSAAAGTDQTGVTESGGYPTGPIDLPIGNVTTNSTELQALMDFKAGLSNSSALASWANDTSPCSGRWQGVSCAGGVVAFL